MLGDYRPGLSDLDFAGVLARPPTGLDLAGLRRAHARLRPAMSLDGLWISPGDLDGRPQHAPPGLATLGGRLAESTNAHRDPVTWRTLARHGAAVRGEIGQVHDDEAELKAWLAGNLGGYWRRWREAAARPVSVRAAQLLTDWGVVWTALGVARQLVTLDTGEIVSKTEAGRRIAAVAPPRFAPLLAEAVALREAVAGGPAGSRFRRRREALAFMAWAIARGSERQTA